MPAVRHAWSFAPASRSWSVPRSPKWFVPKKVEDLRANSWSYTITTTATDEMFSNSMVVSNLEVNGLNAILASQELEMMADSMQAGRSILHLSYQSGCQKKDWNAYADIVGHYQSESGKCASKAPRLQRSTTSTALQGRDVLRGTVGSALLTGGLGGANCLNCKVSQKIWIIMGGYITISQPRFAPLERPWPRCSSAAGWSRGFQATNSAGRHELTSGNDVTGDIE